MTDVTATCDRCGKQIAGAEYEPGPKNKLGATAGFYRIITGGEAWGKYTDPGEYIICDACMWRDPRYQADYGTASADSLPK